MVTVVVIDLHNLQDTPLSYIRKYRVATTTVGWTLRPTTAPEGTVP